MCSNCLQENTTMLKKIIFSFCVLSTFFTHLTGMEKYGQLWTAVLNGDDATVENILADPSKAHSFYPTLLHIAAGGGHCRVAQLLINFRPQVTEQESDTTIQIDYPSIIDCTDIDYDTPLHCASREGHLKMVQLLCDNGANINSTNREDKTPLYYASQHNRISVVAYLLQQYTINVGINNPLHRAAQEGNAQVVELFLIHRPELINTTDLWGDTALCVATEYNHTEVASILLNAKDVDVNKRKTGSFTPLDHACNQKNNTLIPLLLAKDAKKMTDLDNKSYFYFIGW